MEARLKTRTFTLLLIFVVLGVYYPVIFAPLNSVDDPGMYHYLLNLDSLRLHDIFLPGGKGTYYRPLLTLSFLIDKYLWGLEESFMHLQNVVLHLCNTLLVFWIALRAGRLLAVDSPLPPFLAALFFAIHPINAESIAWISGRTDPLACLFILSSAYLLLRRETGVIAELLAALCLLLACLAKETAIFFLPAAIVFPFFIAAETKDRVPLSVVLKENILHFMVFLSAGACYLSLRLLAFSSGDAGMGRVVTHVAGGEGAAAFTNIRYVLKAAGFYVKKLFIPFPLNFGIVHVSDLYIIPGVLLCIILVWLLVRRTLPGFFLVSAASIGSSALMVVLLKITWTPVAERYMYVPSAFFLVGLAFALQGLQINRNHSKITTALVACLVAVAIYGTAQRNLLWQDNLAFFQDTMEKSPDFIPAQNEMARALYARGMSSEAFTVIQSMKLSEGLNNFQYGLMSKAAALANNGDFDGARKLLRKGLENPGRHEARLIERLLKLNERDVLLDKSGRMKYYEENVRLLSRLYEITGNPFCQYRLGQMHMFKGDRAKAREAFQRVVAQSPEKVYYYKPAKKLLEKMSD